MTLKDIAYKNIIRRKSRSFFIFLGILIGVSTVVAIMSFINAMTMEINHKMEKFGANIIIVPKIEELTLTYGGFPLGGVSFDMQEIDSSELQKIRTIKNAANIAALGPVLLGTAEINDRKVLVAGIDFSSQKILKPWWKINGTGPGPGEALLGSRAASVLKVHPGQKLQVKKNSFTVSGIILETGTQDDELVFLDLGTAQKLLGRAGKISMAEVAALCTACPVEDMVKQMAAVLPNAKVMALQNVVSGRMHTLDQLKSVSVAVSSIIVAVGSLIVLVTMMGNIRERTSEIGILRAIGFRKSHVAAIIMMESGLISALAGLFGYTAGMAVAKGLSVFTAGADVHALSFDASMAAFAFGLAITVGLASSIYPAILATRLDPSEALRNI